MTLLTACSGGGTPAPASSASSSASSAGSSPEASAAPSAASPQESSPAAGEPSQAPAGAAPGSSQVGAAVKAFYERYAADPTAPDNRAYLTTAAASAVFAPGGDADRVLCAQNTPSSMTFGAPVLSSGEATVVVTTHWTGSPDQRITVTVALPDMLISAITCPTA